jgi:hypothetical protein
MYFLDNVPEDLRDVERILDMDLRVKPICGLCCRVQSKDINDRVGSFIGLVFRLAITLHLRN